MPSALLVISVDHITGKGRKAVFTFQGGIMSIQAINSRNQFKGTIKEIVPGPVVSEVDVETSAGIVTSVITSRSISDLKLRVGSEVLALVKSTEVSLAKV
jgi:molybdopterin-binding protein